MGYVLASLGVILLVGIAVVLLMSFQRRRPVEPLGKEGKEFPADAKR